MGDQHISNQDQYLLNNQNETSVKELFLNIKGWVRYLLSKWMILVTVGLTGGAVGYTYACFQKYVYTASLTFALEDDKSGGGGGLGGALGLASQFGLELGMNAGGAFTGANLMELMKSRTVVEMALLDSVTIQGRITSLAEYYIDINEMRKGWEKKPELKKIQFLPGSDRNQFSFYQDSVLGMIYESLIKSNVTVEQKDKKVSIIKIDVKYQNELFAKYFTESLAKVVSEFYAETKSKKARINLAILEFQSDSIRRELNSAITGVAAANDNTYNLNPALNVKRVPSVKRQVDVQANTAILTTLVQNLELAKVSVRKETPLIQIIDKPILPLKKEKIGKLKSMLGVGFLFGFLCMGFLIIRKTFRKYIQ